MNNLVIKATGLVKRYKDVEALNSVDLELNKGEVLVILGHNGAGKTTLMEILEGIICPDEGKVTIFNRNSSSHSVKEKIGVQVEASFFEDELKIKEILTLYSSFYPSHISQKVLLEKLGLVEKENAFFKNLSRGMKQKVAIATALIGDPDLLFFDEVTSGLDVESRKDIWSILEDVKANGTSIIITTHDMVEAEELGDRVILLVNGRVIKEGSLYRIKGDFNTKFRVEYKGYPLASENDALNLLSRGDRHTVFTDNPEEVVLQIKSQNGSLINTAPISLEDIYRYYTAGKEY